MARSAREVVQDYVDTHGRGERETALEFIGIDVEVVVPPSVPWGGTTHGRDAYAKRAAETQKHIKMDPSGTVQVVQAGDQALLMYDGHATTNETGRTFDHRLRELFTVEDGKVTKIEIVYWDTAMILEALRGG